MTKRHSLRQPCANLRPVLAMVLAATLNSGPALSQTVAPNAAPTGGSVVGGAATIAKTPNTTQINQSTNRAVINWQSFSVGQNQGVNFQQPSSQSMTLNRVTGPDMSVIAGRMTANGGIALVNQSGVFFAQGAQVQAQSVIVSTADITNQNFMAGGPMAFNQPGKPDARIVNDGSITVRQAGLAALVAPQVANHGVIQARLGTVVLAGAETHVIDLNGDGLVSFDVTGAVHQAPNNGEALVTNTGVIRANGGSVELTAAAADGIVQNLVRAGGKIQANTDAATGTTGRILLEGTGGSISVAGDVSAQGRAAGTRGGTIGVLADRVQVESTGRINASGRAGGGTIAIGTSLPGAATQRLAQGTGIAKGAVIKADATGNGNGGHVVVNASRQAAISGSISVRGGPSGGNGGTVEVSSHGGLALSATIDAGAPAGTIGSVLLDPDTLTVVADIDPRANVTNGELTGGILAFNTDPGAADYITVSQIGGITGALTLQATTTIDVEAEVNKALGDLTLTSNGGLIINAPITLGAGNLALGGNVVTINAALTVPAANVVALTAQGAAPSSITEGINGLISAGTLTVQSDGTITMQGANQVATIAAMNGNGIVFHNAADLQIAGPVTSPTAVTFATDGNLLVTGNIALQNSDILLQAGGNLTVAATSTISAVLNDGNAASIFLEAAAPTAGFDATLPGTLSLAGVVTAATAVTLDAGTGGIIQSQGTISGQTLAVQSGGDALLDRGGVTGGTPNSITGAIAATAAGDFELDNGVTPINVPATITAGTIGLRTTGAINLTNNCPSVLTSCIPVPANLNADTGRVTLQAGSLAFIPGDAVIGGVVEISSAAQQPLVAGDPAGTVIAGSFMVNQDVLAAINTSTLRLGAGTFRGTTGVTATTLTLGGPITLADGLDLRSLGDITQAAPFAVGTLAGASGGNIVLTLPGNAATTVGDLSAKNALGLALNDTMAIAGTVSGTNVTLTAGTDMGETGAGTVVANQLTLNAPDGAIAMGGDNKVTQLVAATAATDLAFNDAAASLEVPLGTTIQPGASLTLVNTGDLTINGTASGTTTVLRSSDGTLTVNGRSAIARSGTLALSAPTVVTNGLISSATTTIVSASSATLGGQALGISLDVYGQSITFNGLDARTMRVLLLPGPSGTASGTLQAGGLEIAGGSGATLLGSIDGVTSGAAAALGVRASGGGQNLGNQPPEAAKFTFNGCQIAVVACQPVTVIIPPVTPNRPTPPGTVVFPPNGVASSPGTILSQNDPRRFDPSLTDVVLGLPTPPPVGLFVLPSRDPGEDLELAPPNVRSEDF